jgi:hypothetical protein
MFNLGSEFINKYNQYIEQNIDEMTCHDLSNLYFDILNAIKGITKSSANLTGFSEFLSYAAINHAFINNRNDLRMTLSEYIKVGKSYKSPDLLIYKDSKIVRLISVKAYEKKMDADKLRDDIYKINQIREAYNPYLNSLTLIFNNANEDVMKEIRDENELHSYLELRNTHCSLKDELNRLLQMSEI